MIIVDKKTNKQTKQHLKICPICEIQFISYRKSRVVCSFPCKSKLASIDNFKSTYRNCLTCKKQFIHRPSREKIKNPHLFCSIECRYPNKKLNLPRGQYFSSDGYIVINKTLDGRKQIKLHRYIMEKSLGRKLTSLEIVHHINNDKLDNRIENLQVVTRKEHNIIHKFLTKK